MKEIEIDSENYHYKKVTEEQETDNYQVLSTVVTKEDIATAIEDEYGVLYSPDGIRLLKCNNNKLRNYTVKAGTMAICDNAFYMCDIRTIEFSKELILIGKVAFGNCINLTSVKFPKELISLDDAAFMGCYNLTSVKFPKKLISLGNMAFMGCYALTSVKFPKKLISLGIGAFASCINLMSVKFPKELISLKDATFMGCNNLTSVELPKDLISMGVGSFADCSNLTLVELPDGLVEFGKDMFKYCDNLEKIYIRCSAGADEVAVLEKFKRLLPKRLHNKIEIVNDKS